VTHQDTWAALRADFRAALPGILDGTEDAEHNKPPLGITPDPEWDSGPADRRIKMIDVMVAISEATGIPASAVTGPRRPAPIVNARHMAYYLMLEFCTHASAVMIGRYMNRDHSTVLYGARKYAARRDLDDAQRVVEDRARAIMGDGH
jgi:hypothetical protein